MRPCPRCGRSVPEVRGAPEQACPHCGHGFATPRSPPVGAPAPPPVDPVGALTFAGRALRTRYPRLLAIWAPAVVANALVTLLVAYAIPGDPTTMAVPDRLRALGLVTPALGVVVALELGLWALVAGALSGGVRPVLARMGPLVGLSLLLALTYFAGLVLLVIPFFVFLHWFLYAPAAFAEGRTVSEALDASRRFARERRAYGFTALVALAWVVAAVATYALSLALEPALLATRLAPATAEALAGALATWPFAPLVPLLPASYWALAARSAAAAPASPPAATGARATTTCPRCGTLVPYTPTGAPVDVTCPSCGTAGRVL